MIHINFKLVDENDASFINELRASQKAGGFLNKTPSDIAFQIEWIKQYKIREYLKQEYYFIISEKGIPKGTYRLYNVDYFSFTIGSWLFKSCDDLILPVKTDIFFSDYGFSTLNLDVQFFDVRKQNKRVLSYHSLKSPLLYKEDDLNYFFKLTKENWNISRKSVMEYFGIE